MYIFIIRNGDPKQVYVDGKPAFHIDNRLVVMDKAKPSKK